MVMGLRKLDRIIIMIGFGLIFYCLFSGVSSYHTAEILLPDIKTCGIQNSDRIIGGTQTELDEYPWMALLKYFIVTDVGYTWRFNCGGFLISSKYVMTAAHCVFMEPWQLTYVRLGEWDISKNRDCIGSDCSNAPTEILIEKIIPHRDYNAKDKQQRNDIALLRLSQNIKFSDFIKPICLPIARNLREADFNGFEMEVAGWGMTNSGPYSVVKLKVRVPVVDNKHCNQMYYRQNLTITTKQICAGGRYNEDSCKGDSGGPLMVSSNSGNWIVIGIVSYGMNPCGMQGWPAVHTKVGPYADWMLSQLEP